MLLFAVLIFVVVLIMLMGENGAVHARRAQAAALYPQGWALGAVAWLES
jgi:hypothetical protein